MDLILLNPWFDFKTKCDGNIFICSKSFKYVLIFRKVGILAKGWIFRTQSRVVNSNGIQVGMNLTLI